MTRAVRFLGAILALSSAGFFLAAAQRSWSSLRQVEWNVTMLSGGIVALLLYLATYALVTRTWQLLLCGLGSPVSFPAAARILLVAQFAKYLPGNVGQHLGRIALARRAGLPVRTLLASMLVETVTLVLVACFCSLAALDFLFRIAAGRGERAAISFALLGAACVGAAAAALCIPGARRWVSSCVGWTSALFASENRLVVLQVSLLHALNFGLGALCIRALYAVLPGHDSPGLLPLLGVYSLAWLAGFLAPGAPAGLGVRDAVLLVGLTPLSSRESALLVAASLRIVTILGDLLAVLTGLALRAAARPPQSAKPQIASPEWMDPTRVGACEDPPAAARRAPL